MRVWSHSAFVSRRVLLWQSSPIEIETLYSISRNSTLTITVSRRRHRSAPTGHGRSAWSNLGLYTKIFLSDLFYILLFGFIFLSYFIITQLRSTAVLFITDFLVLFIIVWLVNFVRTYIHKTKQDSQLLGSERCVCTDSLRSLFVLIVDQRYFVDMYFYSACVMRHQAVVLIGLALGSGHAYSYSQQRRIYEATVNSGISH